ncbi:hypothetical protein COV92_03440 [Candidatus Uhrbacteria bacterium CG11_big_fil_rev_8_21_14_0_20_41_9]|nr:MAG: hypothetical protein COV92_03440 [Candidatus Uhrbacteria bacterium CG11_big_fil_rev_8_21_14_0_20_41_9]
MNKLERQFEPRPNFENLDEKLSNHGLETKESLRLRSEIKKFFETRHLAISQELGTANFSIIIGGSIQAGTADERSDVDLTIILDRGNRGEIWVRGGIGETDAGVRGFFLFRQDALKQQLRRDIDVNLLSLESILVELENLESSESEEDIFFLIDHIVQIFSPQLYQAVSIDDFRKLIIMKLTSMSEGEKIWNQKIAPQLRATLIERVGDEKGETWPEREERDLTESRRKNDLTKKISDKLKGVQIPNFQEIRMLYGV